EDDEEATHVQMSPLGGMDLDAAAAGVLADKSRADAEEATDPGPARTPAPAAARTEAPEVSDEERTEPEPVASAAAAPEAAAASSAPSAEAEDDHDEHDDHHGPDEPSDDLIAMLVRSSQTDPSA